MFGSGATRQEREEDQRTNDDNLPSSTPANSLPSAFTMPALTGTAFVAASEPAMPSINTIGP